MKDAKHVSRVLDVVGRRAEPSRSCRHLLSASAPLAMLVLGISACTAPLEEIDTDADGTDIGEVGALEDAIRESAQALIIGSQMDCPSGASGACTVRNMPLLFQDDNRVDYDVWDMRADGCYDASIATVLTTALVNRTTASSLTGRTLTWSNIPAGNNGAPSPIATTKDYEQLSQQYRWAKQHHGPLASRVPGVEPFYFHEMVNDFGGSAKRFPTNCDPKIYKSCTWNTTVIPGDLVGAAFFDWTTNVDHVTNDYLTSLLTRGFSTMIAYGRYAPSKVWDTGLGGWRITFNRVGQHKVAFSGYQVGSFPLRINDVGNGIRYNVTVTNDMSAKASYAGVAAMNVKKFDFPNGRSRQTLMLYDPAQLSDVNVNFVEHVDALSLGLPLDGPVRQAFSGTWETGWTSLMPFELNGESHQIAYNSTTGAVHFDKFFPNAQGANTVWSSTWGTGFTRFVPYYINGYPYFIVYNTTNGAVHFDTFPSNLQGPIINGIHSWPAGLTNITHFVLGGENYLLIYSGLTGAIRFDKINATGSDSTTVWSGTWGTGWTDFVVYQIGGHPYLTAYNSTTGLAHHDRVWESLFGVETLGTANLGTGLTLSQIDFAGPSHFLTYLGSTGAGRIERVTLDGSKAGETWGATLLAGATSVIPFRQSGKSYTLTYNKASGAVRAYELTLF
ncbi:hypothetical protein [Sorangium sp. So ce388]|uniref:hypothetical protein n=1 Tax=Sorangium sp. So ce388 TaxID=3133309 RepID=UPI003F5BCE5B